MIPGGGSGSDPGTLAALLATDPGFADHVLSSVPIGIAVSDGDGRIVQVNATFARIVGYRPEELVGRDYRTLTVDEDLPSTHEQRRRLLAGEIDRYHLDKRYRHRDGHAVDVEVWSSVLRDDDGEPVLQFGVVQDRTAQRMLLAREARLAAILDSIPDGIVTFDRDWIVTSANDHFERILRIEAGQAVGRNLWAVVPSAVGSGFHRTCQRAWREGSAQSVVEYLDPPGLYIEANAYPSPVGMAVFLRDVTARVERQRTLEQRLRTEQTDLARLRALDRAKSTFLTAVSHELRTPLSVVLGMAETLIERGRNMPGAQRAEVEQALLNQARQLARLVDDLVDVDRLVRGTVATERTRFDVAPMVREQVATFGLAPRVVLDVPGSLQVDADQVQVERIVVNLLSNVVKYAPHGAVDIRLTRLGRDGVRIEVRDRGPGIPPSAREHVFAPYFRLDDEHPSPGTGVGLSLVAEFARLHGGRAYLGEVAGPGARVVVELPGPSNG